MSISENQLDNLTHNLLNKLSNYGISLDTDLACDLNDALSDFLTDKCEVEITERDTTKNTSEYPSPVVDVKTSNALNIEVDSVRTLEFIQDRFECHTRPNSWNEIVLDGAMLEETERLYTLCELLSISASSEIGKSITKANYIVFFV